MITVKKLIPTKIRTKSAYLISVGTDLLRPIDGVLKNKLNYAFQI